MSAPTFAAPSGLRQPAANQSRVPIKRVPFVTPVHKQFGRSWMILSHAAHTFKELVQPIVAHVVVHLAQCRPDYELLKPLLVVVARALKPLVA